MAIEVHQEYLKRRYVTGWCSLACFINFLIILGAAILPLYIAWASQNFWIKEHIKYEQPRVAYKSQAAVFLSGWKGVPPAARPFQLAWTTSPSANDLLGSIVRPPVLKSGSTDTNYDAKPDEIRISAAMPLAADEVITGVTAIAWLEVQLSAITRLKMDALAVASYSSGVPGTALVADGDLHLAQRAPLPYVMDGIYTPYLNAPLPEPLTAISLAQVLPEPVLAVYRSRNFTAQLDVPYPQWAGDYSYSPVAEGSQAAVTTGTAALQGRSFHTQVRIRVPPVPVLVRPGVSEELKHGYIQYLAFLVLSVLLAWLLRKVLFGYHILETSVFVDAPRSKIHLE